jgi:hypothetical protein
MIKKLFFPILFLSLNSLQAQVDSTQEEMVDFSQFEVVEPTDVKRFCTSKVLGLSPSKLISIGYDFQGKHELKNYLGNETYQLNGDSNQAAINNVSGIRIAANYPILSNTKWLINMGATYWRTNYNMSSFDNNNYVISKLQQNGLTTIGLNTTIFKPLNEKYFLLAFASADANGDYKLSSSDIGSYLAKPKITAAAFFGKKRSDYSILGFGLSRTYRPGALGVIPLILFNHTFPSRKWGIETLFPARFALRRTINTRNLLFFGYELEGNSYSIGNISGAASIPTYDNLELRRSELRPRITYEFSLTGFIWLSVQAGYRINYSFDVDQGDIFRLIGSDKKYHMVNTLTNPLYFQISLNLVSP